MFVIQITLTMLKKLFFAALILIINVYNANSQAIELDYGDMANIGDGFIYAVKHFKNSEMTVSKLDAMNWDISGFEPESFDTVRFYSKNRSRYGNLFPNAEILKFQTKKNMEFLTVDSSKIKMHGIINDYLGLKATVVLVFPTELALYKFPIKVGSYLNDSISKKFVSSYGLKQYADSVRIDLDMSNYSEFDTSGIIKTPMDSYNTIREKNTVYKKIVAYKNSRLMGWMPAPEFSSKTNQIFYRWFSKKCGIAVMEAEADANGNITTIRYQYRQPMEVSLEKTDVNCKGKNTGSIQVLVSGGTPDYKFRWSNGKRGRKLDSLKAGVYSVEVTDSKGTKITKSIEITEPNEELKLKIQSRNIRCYGEHDATLKAVVTGGTKPYYIVWSDDTEAEEISNKGTGVYGCIIRDAQRCFVWDSVEITAPDVPLMFSPKVEHSLCKSKPKGALIFDVSGGGKPYKYFLEDKETTEKAENLLAGTYNMKVIDNWGCEISRTATIHEPEKELEALGEVSHVTCSGGENGSITIKPTGGTPGYSFLWSNDATTKDIKNLSSGVYRVKISDSHNCAIEKSFTINAPQNILKLDYEISDVTCKNGHNGIIRAKGSGGSEPYLITCNNKLKGEKFENLKAGNYDLKLTDHNNCIIIETVIISEPEEEMTAEIETENSPCRGKALGKISVKAENGKPPYRYVWENNQTGETHENLSAGNYSVKVYDSGNCMVEKKAVITWPEKELSVEVKTQKPSSGKSDGSAIISVSGGAMPYNVIWEDGNTDLNRREMSKGKYSFKVEDKNGCIIEKNIAF
ncbi:MAG: SprB repeat-containing protein [Bacteroidales bacterium]|nr:SprB repeat-containing protein [Bacteroidales bacterium]